MKTDGVCNMRDGHFRAGEKKIYARVRETVFLGLVLAFAAILSLTWVPGNVSAFQQQITVSGTVYYADGITPIPGDSLPNSRNVTVDTDMDSQGMETDLGSGSYTIDVWIDMPGVYASYLHNDSVIHGTAYADTNESCILDIVTDLLPPDAGPVYNENTGRHYPSLQSAINLANDGDVLTVTGTVTQDVVVDGKSLTIRNSIFSIHGSLTVTGGGSLTIDPTWMNMTGNLTVASGSTLILDTKILQFNYSY